jgi:hypothetical protein
MAMGQVWAYDFARNSRLLATSDRGARVLEIRTARSSCPGLLRWLLQANIDTAHTIRGSPGQNGNNESFNGKFRDECLSMEWFRNRITQIVVLAEIFGLIVLFAVTTLTRLLYLRRSLGRLICRSPWLGVLFLLCGQFLHRRERRRQQMRGEAALRKRYGY